MAINVNKISEINKVDEMSEMSEMSEISEISEIELKNINSIQEYILNEENYDNKYKIIIHEYGSILNAMLDKNGCNYIQLMLDNINNNDAYKLMQEMYGNVQIIIDSPHGNYVIQKMIIILPASMCLFIIDEIYNNIFHIVCNKYSCRVVLRLIEHLMHEPKMTMLFVKLLRYPMKLCNDIYGQYIIECIIEHGINTYKKIIIDAIYKDITQIINNKKKKYIHYISIIENILMYCNAIEKNELVKLMKDNIKIINETLKKSKYKCDFIIMYLRLYVTDNKIDIS